MIAIFPARMNPPHLGHIKTLFRIMDSNKYDKIIVAISDFDFDGEKPNILITKEVIKEIYPILKHFPIFEIIEYHEPFRRRKSFDDLPHFDVVVTASKGVYDNVIELGLKAEYVERSPFYRGEYIREAYLKGMESEKEGIC